MRIDVKQNWLCVDHWELDDDHMRFIICTFLYFSLCLWKLFLKL